MVSLDAGFHDPIRDCCDIGGLVCCRDWTTTVGHLWHPENCRRSISGSFASSPVDSDRVRLRLRGLHCCLPDLYIPHYSPRACGSSCLPRSVWFYKERIPAARARQSETVGGQPILVKELKEMNLPLLSASFLAFTLTLYVILDGFDLGVGILLLFQPAETSRDHMV